MQIHVPIQILLIPALLVLSALFAAAEGALFSLSRAQLEVLREKKPRVFHKIRALIFRPDELLSTMVIGNECLNIMLGTLVTSTLLGQYPEATIATKVLAPVLKAPVETLKVGQVPELAFTRLVIGCSLTTSMAA